MRELLPVAVALGARALEIALQPAAPRREVLPARASQGEVIGSVDKI